MDPALAQTGQPYSYGNNDPLNVTDPSGLRGWYCIDGQTHYYRGDKFGNPNGTCEQVDAEFVFDLAIEQAQVEAYLEAQNAAVDAYIAAVSGTSSGGIGQTYGEICRELGIGRWVHWNSWRSHRCICGWWDRISRCKRHWRKHWRLHGA